MWISVKQLKQLDEISIRTQNSVYLFRVTDPTEGKGLLSGGLLGQVEHEASLCDEADIVDQEPQLAAKLEIGCCAFFYVYVRGSLRRLSTSEILDVSWARTPAQGPTEHWEGVSNMKIGVLGILLGLMFLPVMSVSAQSCNPAVVNYIVRDEQGRVLRAEELKSIHQQLPKTVGNADTAVDEVSFTSDGVTYYWPESANWDEGKKVPALEFANAGTCTLNLPRVELDYRRKRMILIFNISIERSQNDRRPVIDSVPFQEGTYVLDLSGWSRVRDKMIPATRWRRQNLGSN